MLNDAELTALVERPNKSIYAAVAINFQHRVKVRITREAAARMILDFKRAHPYGPVMYHLDKNQNLVFGVAEAEA